MESYGDLLESCLLLIESASRGFDLMLTERYQINEDQKRICRGLCLMADMSAISLLVQRLRLLDSQVCDNGFSRSRKLCCCCRVTPRRSFCRCVSSGLYCYRAFDGHTRLAILPIASSLRHWSLSSSRFPYQVEAKPHCGQMASWSMSA